MTGDGRYRRTNHVRHPGAAGASALVRRRHAVGVSEGMRGARGAGRVSFWAFLSAARLGRRPPGRIPRSASRSARKAAHITKRTPRRSGRRDLGSAGYGWAPVNRRRRPVLEGGVGARFLGSLIDPASRTTGGPRVRRSFMRATAIDDPSRWKGTTRRRVRLSRTRRRPALHSSRARSWCRSSRSSY